jgi:hypothetical protein
MAIHKSSAVSLRRKADGRRFCPSVRCALSHSTIERRSNGCRRDAKHDLYQHFGITDGFGMMQDADVDSRRNITPRLCSNLINDYK